jgi:hypothetical protein
VIRSTRSPSILNLDDVHRERGRLMEECWRPMQWYVSRRVKLPLPLAATALDRLTHPVSDPVTFGWLRLNDAKGLPFPDVARRLYGYLKLGDLRRPIRVELELTAWSHLESELGLRPIKPPASPRAGRYGTTAALTLEDLGAELVARGQTGTVEAAPLRCAS